MPKQEINYEKVAMAAESVRLSGMEPSLTNVCESLGVVRPTPNLSFLLEQWYHTQPEFQRSINAPLSENIQVKPYSIEKSGDLEKSLSLLRATLESTADGIMMVNGHGQVVDWNQKFVEMWRIPSHMLESGTESIGFEYILSQVSNPATVVADVEFLYKNPDWQGELPHLQFKDGRVFERFTQPQRIGREIVGRVYSFRDITEKLMAEDELRIRERAIEASILGVAIIDISQAQYPIIYVNKAFERITGHTEKETIGQELAFLHGNSIDDINHKRIMLAIRELREETVELESFRSNGESYWCEMSISPVYDSFEKIKHYVCIFNDITQRREMENQLLRQATHDALTMLPNRVLFIDRVEQAILRAKKEKKIFAFLFLDLDRFKMINDTLGHTLGDKFLQVISQRILGATSDFDTVARIGGDEFVILLQNISNESEAGAIAKMLLESIEKPSQIGKHSLRVTGSIGISFYPKDGVDYESLMKNADLSMYYAKDNGRNNYRAFDEEMNRHIINRMQLDTALRDSLELNEFHLAYQPLIDLGSNRTVGLEALLRWDSHILGSVSPVDFIGMAEETGLIVGIGQWALEQACKQLMSWHKKGLKNLSMAVNISGRQFRQTRLKDIVKELLEKTNLDPSFLELELTESLLIEDVEHAVKTMYELKDMGVRLVIDDFGTGYSSLSYLKQFPVDKLKIDRSFITEIVSINSDAAIARAIINLGHSLNLEVLAEGIETALQKDFLFKHGCDFAQGYYFSKPQKGKIIENYLKKTS